jgi:hypothetical protein
MNKQFLTVFAICAAIVLGASVIAYRPLESEAQEFRYPVGIPPSLGTVSNTQVGDQQIKTISLSGIGSASAQANEALLTLGVQTENKVASAAVDENAGTMTAVIAAIKSLGIADDEIETISYSISPIYDSNWQNVVGYRVINLVQVKISDLDLVGKIIDAASAAGANRIDGVSFGLSDDLAQQLKFDAYKKALGDAETKAQVITEGLNLKLTGVLSVSESYYYPYTPIRAVPMNSAYDKVSTPIYEGSLSVSVTVNIVYTFE